MQERCLQTRLYPYRLITPSFSNQSRTVWTGQRQNLRTEYQRQITHVRKLEQQKLQEITGLDTTIDWKNTGDNSYDGEKLKLLVHDEVGKWERPQTY